MFEVSPSWPDENPSHFERAVARMLEPYRAYLTQDMCFDDTAATRLLERCGVERLTLTADLVHRLVDQALAADEAEFESVLPGRQ